MDVPADANRDLALESLLFRVNAQLTGRRIQTAGVRKEDQLEILILDLVDLGEHLEPSGWYNSFQGSAGGSAIQAFLVATFLQQQYGGDWFDAAKFLLNGQPMIEMDHVNLSGVFLREASLTRYIPVQINEPGDVSDAEIFRCARHSRQYMSGTLSAVSLCQSAEI